VGSGDSRSTAVAGTEHLAQAAGAEVGYAVPMVVAQAIGEYGGVAGAVSGAFTRAYNGVQSFLYDAEPSTWLMIGAVVVVVWWLRPR